MVVVSVAVEITERVRFSKTEAREVGMRVVAESWPISFVDRAVEIQVAAREGRTVVSFLQNNHLGRRSIFKFEFHRYVFIRRFDPRAGVAQI